MKKTKRILFVFGTRPEAIKLAPLILKCREYQNNFAVKICVTGQHKEMLYQVLSFFDIEPDVDLGNIKSNQTLFDITTHILNNINSIIDDFLPEYLVVQGDTTSAFAGALAGFYKKIKIVHVEAGLRSNDLYSPWPEEGNRLLISKLANYHFTPTYKATAALEREGITQGIFEVGNTVVDALLLADKKNNVSFTIPAVLDQIDPDKRIILITGHRRESFGDPFQQICEAIKELANRYENCLFLYPVHLNPNVQKQVYATLSNLKNVLLIPPVDYPVMVWLIKRAHIVLTDSGGIQEEAPAFGKPVLVMRDVTERTEGVDAGTAKLVGTQKNSIINAVAQLMEDEATYAEMAKAVNPYGNGTSSQQIIEILINEN
ncbi:MAG TPA: UDP-N-acetylglucosamine 2-epimerase (non-hydrolyzing) [Niabella sp.]|nr:UDP-N-acetylglucosamine 2-epimerase (non-hydrolyzing) [Niabella sp.]